MKKILEGLENYGGIILFYIVVIIFSLVTCSGITDSSLSTNLSSNFYTENVSTK